MTEMHIPSKEEFMAAARQRGIEMTKGTCKMGCGFRARIDGIWTCANCGRKHEDSGDQK